MITPNTMSATKNDSLVPREISRNLFAILWRMGLRVALSGASSIASPTLNPVRIGL